MFVRHNAHWREKKSKELSWLDTLLAFGAADSKAVAVELGEDLIKSVYVIFPRGTKNGNILNVGFNAINASKCFLYHFLCNVWTTEDTHWEVGIAIESKRGSNGSQITRVLVKDICVETYWKVNGWDKLITLAAFQYILDARDRVDFTDNSAIEGIEVANPAASGIFFGTIKIPEIHCEQLPGSRTPALTRWSKLGLEEFKLGMRNRIGAWGMKGNVRIDI